MDRLIDRAALASVTACRIIITTSTYEGEIKRRCLARPFVLEPTKYQLIDENELPRLQRDPTLFMTPLNSVTFPLHRWMIMEVLRASI